ncbi:MAG: hypothetical protein CBC13_11500 [Planctomycetia bacterium TMED53]|nr:MAG: hypothetical protein CBC13_11500 [Planctomycetia bacterium TMED53]
MTQRQVSQLSFESSHSIHRVSVSGGLKTSNGSVSLVNFDEVQLDQADFNYRPGITLRQGPMKWSLNQIHSHSRSVAPFEATAGSLSFPAGDYRFDNSFTSTRIMQDLPLELLSELRSPKIHWLAGLDFVDYEFSAQSTDNPLSVLKLEDLDHIPFTGVLLDWRMKKTWNLQLFFTKSLVSITGSQTPVYRDIGAAFEWSPSTDWTSHLTLSRKNLEFDRRAGGELLDLDFEIHNIELGVTFRF